MGPSRRVRMVVDAVFLEESYARARLGLDAGASGTNRRRLVAAAVISN